MSFFDSPYKKIFLEIEKRIKGLDDLAAESNKAQHKLEAAMRVQEETLAALSVRVQSLETKMPEEETQTPGERARRLFGRVVNIFIS